MTRKSSHTNPALVWAWLRATTWRERVGMALGILFALGVFAVVLVQGYGLGAHIGRLGWLCGQMISKGNPFCIPDPSGGGSR